MPAGEPPASTKLFLDAALAFHARGTAPRQSGEATRAKRKLANPDHRRRKTQNTLTVTALLVLAWNWEEPTYWALKEKLPGPKNSTVNVASATPLTTCTVALPKTLPLTSRFTVPPGSTAPEAGLMMAVKVTVGGLNHLRGLTRACSVVVVPMRLFGGVVKIDSSWSF